MNKTELRQNLRRAVEFREHYFTEPHDSAVRVINGFTEHLPGLVIDLFAKTAVIHDYSPDGDFERNPEDLKEILLEQFRWLKAILLKKRTSSSIPEKNGVLIHGIKPDTRIREHDVNYAIDLTMNRDNSFYHDTRLLRKWLIENMDGRTVLNTFAYTGSLGAAALAGHAEQVIQTDLSDHFLDLARRSYTLNSFYYNKKSFLAGDFFPVISRLKKEQREFDCVILDPPFFSKTGKGTVDLVADPLTIINKVRPLISRGGTLIVVNNALYLSGRDFMNSLDSLCDGVYLKKEMILPVPSDFTGFEPDYRNAYSVSPEPFNHPTKIVILRADRK